MARRPKSPTRTISNRGEYPRFIGYFPCTKGAKVPLLFDSISALKVGIYLEWLPRVLRVWNLSRGNIPLQMATSPSSASPTMKQRRSLAKSRSTRASIPRTAYPTHQGTRLSSIGRTMARQGYRYQVLYRKILERRGFIQTISKLRHYGQLTFPDPVLRHALAVLASATPRTLGQYVSTALDNGIRVGVLYHLAYHRKLRLRYELPRHMELELCRV